MSVCSDSFVQIISGDSWEVIFLHWRGVWMLLCWLHDFMVEIQGMWEMKAKYAFSALTLTRRLIFSLLWTTLSIKGHNIQSTTNLCDSFALHVTRKTPLVWSVIENSNNRKKHTNGSLWRQLHNLPISTSVVATTTTTTTRQFAEKSLADLKDKTATTFLVNRCLVHAGLKSGILQSAGTTTVFGTFSSLSVSKTSFKLPILAFAQNLFIQVSLDEKYTSKYWYWVWTGIPPSSTGEILWKDKWINLKVSTCWRQIKNFLFLPVVEPWGPKQGS